MEDINFKLVTKIGLASLVLVGGCMGINPPYKEWSSRYDGKAKLAHAEQSRKVLIEQAKQS